MLVSDVRDDLETLDHMGFVPWIEDALGRAQHVGGHICQWVATIGRDRALLVLEGAAHAAPWGDADASVAFPVRFGGREYGALHVRLTRGAALSPLPAIGHAAAYRLAHMCGIMLFLAEHVALVHALSRGLPQTPRERLTKRQQDVLLWMAQGASNAEIAQHLKLSVTTVKKHQERIYSKLRVHSRVDAILAAHLEGLTRGLVLHAPLH